MKYALIFALYCMHIPLKLVADQPSKRPTDRSTDNATYRAAIAAKNALCTL